MFCSKAVNDLFNETNKRSLRVVYKMEDANFEDLSIKNSSWTIHENNVHILLTEICKSLNHICPTIMQERFDSKVTPYSLRNNNLLKLPKTSTSRNGTQALCFKFFL